LVSSGDLFVWFVWPPVADELQKQLQAACAPVYFALKNLPVEEASYVAPWKNNILEKHIEKLIEACLFVSWVYSYNVTGAFHKTYHSCSAQVLRLCWAWQLSPMMAASSRWQS